MITALIDEIQTLYGEIDRQVATFQLASGLRCRNGCGQCCPGAPVQATVVEMLPAAAALVRADLAGRWLERLAAAPDTCVGYSIAAVSEQGGHCLLYAYRPSVCRLFGFAARRSRLGQLELSVCRTIREDLPEAVNRAAALLAEGWLSPSLTAHQARIFGLDPGGRLMPINQALGIALQRCGLAATLDRLPAPADLPRAG